MQTQVTMIDATIIIPGNNDRTKFDPKALRELADSISQNGLIQPVTVRPLDGTELYQVVAGERRTRAIELLGWAEVPCLIVDLNDEEAATVMLAENVSRDDLDPIDEANAYRIRQDRFGWTIDDIAAKAGVSKVRVQFRLKLLKLRGELQGLVRSGDLSLGYAQIIADADLDPNFQTIALRRLRDNAHPTPPWFRRTCSELLEQQAQTCLFDMPLFGGPALDSQPTEAPTDPPHPSTTIPPKSGRTPTEVLSNQATFWQQAAAAWDALGKPFKRQECEAAALAIRSALAFI